MQATSLFETFEGRSRMLESDMEVGVHEGYAVLDLLLAGRVPDERPAPPVAAG